MWFFRKMVSHAVCLDSSCRLYENRRRGAAWLCGYEVPVGRTLLECSSCLRLSLSLSLSWFSRLITQAHTVLPRANLHVLVTTTCRKGDALEKWGAAGNGSSRTSHANALRFTHAHRQACPVPLSLCVGLPVCFTGMTVNRNLNGVRQGL